MWREQRKREPPFVVARSLYHYQIATKMSVDGLAVKFLSNYLFIKSTP